LKPFVFGLALLAASLAEAAAPPVAQNPWARVPALPTGCYSSQDDFAAKIAAARDAVTDAIAQRDQANDALKERAKAADSGDDATRAARIQALLAKDPQAAMKMMQQIQTAGSTAQTASPTDTANQQKLERELNDLQTQYNAALAKAVAPVDAKFIKRFAPGGDAGKWQGFLSPGAPAADYADWASLNKQWNGEREKACAPWWQASGPFHGWLKRYRDHLVQDHIPWVEQNEQGTSGFMLMMADSPSGSYKSTATLAGVNDYMKHAEAIFNTRPQEPRANIHE
jgi:hypothetical protein